MKSLLLRPLHFAVLLFLFALLVALGVLSIFTRHNQAQVEEIERSVDHLRLLQRVGSDMQRMLQADLSDDRSIDLTMLAEASAGIGNIIALDEMLSGEALSLLRRAQAILSDREKTPRIALAEALGAIRSAVQRDTAAEQRELGIIGERARTAATLAAGALVLLPALALLALWLLRQRVFRPMNDLTRLLSRLSRGEATPIEPLNVDPLLLPLFRNYNDMVARLIQLEAEHRRHATHLEDDVRAATQALLRQQQSLARADRLAAVGELSASVAHELRNPLAGIQMTLANLRHDLHDPRLVERLDLVNAEVQRIVRLLNDLLSKSRQAPELKTWLRIDVMVHELLQLTRYQAPPHIELRSTVPDGLECFVPADSLRQALLNLVLNAVQAIGSDAGTVFIDATLEEGRVHIKVCDDGSGFEASMLEMGVRSFASGRDSGTGLGLAMVQRFVRDMDGELRLSNRQPRGACVELVLPCGARHG